MNHFVKTSVATAVVLGSVLFAASASAGIVNTKHNFSSGSGNNATTDTGEICIFCHTPHGGDTGAPVPLWNKQLTTSTFTTYDQLGTSTLDAGVLNVGSVSLACLTCHDGTQAIDNIINAPGSGGYDATGGGATGLGWTFTSAAGTLDTGTNRLSATSIVNIGTDLTNDHPIGVQYGGGGVSDGVTATNDEDFTTVTQVTGINRWYVDNPSNGTTGSFDKWDFKLYTRVPAATGANVFQNTPTSDATGAQPFVECGSCHDPHFETTTFLRMDGDANPVDASTQSNRGSRVCLACHTK
jgi:hypothetical protein